MELRFNYAKSAGSPNNCAFTQVEVALNLQANGVDLRFPDVSGSSAEIGLLPPLSQPIDDCAIDHYQCDWYNNELSPPMSNLF